MGVEIAAAAALGFGIAGMGASFLSGRDEREAERAAGREEAKIERYNAKIIREDAKLTHQKSLLDIERMKRAKTSLTSAQRAAFAKSGVEFSGSPLLVIDDSATQAEMDIMINRFNSRQEENRLLDEAEERERRASQAEILGISRGSTAMLRSTRDILSQSSKLIS